MKRYLFLSLLVLSVCSAHAQKKTYEYDNLNRLSKVSAYTGNTISYTVTYTYDAVGNRLSKLVAPSCGVLLQTVKSGQWDDVTVWDCGAVPTVAKDVRINSPHTIILPANYTTTVKSLELMGSLQQNVNAKVQIGQQ